MIAGGTGTAVGRVARRRFIRISGVAMLLALGLALGPLAASAQNRFGFDTPKPKTPPPKERFRAAVLDFEPELGDPGSSEKIAEALREKLRKTGRYTILSQAEMRELLAKAPPHIAVCTAIECAVEAGQLLGVKLIVAGRVTRISSRRWDISVVQVDLETGETITTDHDLHKGRPDTAAETLGPITEELTVTASPDGREFRQSQAAWRWTSGGVLSTASLLALGGAYMFMEVARSNQRQADLRTQADQALTVAQFNTFKVQLAEEERSGKILRDQAVKVQVVAAVFAYLAYHVGSRPPRLTEVPVAFAPEITPGGAGLSLSYRW